MNIAMFGGGETRYTLIPQDGEQLIAAFGGLKIDLSQLTLPESLRISALAFAGGIEILVPAGTDVVLNGFSFIGGRNVSQDDLLTVSKRTVIYLEAVAIIGGINVREVSLRSEVYEPALS